MCETCRQNALQFSRRGLLVGAASTVGLLLSKTAGGAKESKSAAQATERSVA